ncbi:MAG TPA: SRPBCC family protein [Polyangia bacterium]|nr:SRPBCC family protein [Polyangia bacterium]
MLLAWLLVACTVSGSSPPADELHQGKVIYGQSDTAALLIRAPVAEVWRRLSDIEHWPTIFGDLESVRLLGRAGKFTEYAMVAKTPLGKKRYSLAFSQPGPYRLDFVLDKRQPADVDDAFGFWELRPADGGSGTIVVYRGRYETSFPLPQFLRRKMAESMLTDLRTFVSRHPAPPPAPQPQPPAPPPSAAGSANSASR